MKKGLIGLLISLTIFSLLPISVYAGQKTNLDRERSYDDDQTPEKQRSTVIAQSMTRGMYIATGYLTLWNDNGRVGVEIETLAYVPVDEIFMNVQVDRLVLRGNQWEWMQVASYDFNYSKEDEPDGKLSKAKVSFTMLEQPKDCYYRLRGYHAVYNNGTMESLSSETDSVYITKREE